MKNTYCILFFLVAFFVEKLSAQITNLVPNGDFEDVDSCFDQIVGLRNVNNWSAAVPYNVCSSDYYNTCQLNHPWLPKEPIDKLIGHGSAAIVLKTTSPNHREYLQSRLIESMLLDTKYIISFKIRPLYIPSQTEWGVNRIEVLFSKEKIKAEIVNTVTPSKIDTTPSYIFHNDFLDTNYWYDVSALYTSVGGEEYLTIGIFSDDSLLDFIPIGINYITWGKQAYYLIDDVMVYKASDTIKEQPDPIMPNVFTPNQDGVNEVYAIENLPENSSLEVFNRWGGLVFTQAPYQNNWPGNTPNGQPLPDGVYFAILSYQDQTGTLQQQKQTVHIFR